MKPRTMTMSALLMALTLSLSSCINPWSFWFPPDVPYQVEDGRILYYIAPGGNDKAQGDAQNPLGSLQGAFNRIRTDWRDDDLGQQFTFKVKAGTYTPGSGLVSSGKYGALLSTRIHNEGGAVMDIRIQFLGTPDHPVILDGQGKVESVFVFQTGLTDHALKGESFEPAVPGTAGDGDPDRENVVSPGGYRVELSGLSNLVVTP